MYFFFYILYFIKKQLLRLQWYDIYEKKTNFRETVNSYWKFLLRLYDEKASTFLVLFFSIYIFYKEAAAIAMV